MDKNQQNQIRRLQDNLSSIRKIAGWTAEQLGEKIGVTKQTISNLENNKSPMNLTQYIAIRSVIDHEIQDNPENTVLPEVVTILLDKDDIDENKYDEVKKAVSVAAVSAAGGIGGATLATILTGLISPLGIVFPIASGIAGAGAAKWLSKLLKK